MLFLDAPVASALQRAEMPVVLTIDTEPDDAWSDHQCESVANVGALRRLSSMMSRFDVRPTVLVTWRVVHDPECRAIIEDLMAANQAEVGAHLHPWENPPFMPDGTDVKYAAFPHELPLPVFADKLGRLTDAITANFGRPTSYRAGRWGLASEHLGVLEELGYEVDTSVFPLADWSETWGIPAAENGRGGIDYRLAPQGPYHPAYADVTQRGSARIIEIPVTVGLDRRIPPALRRVYQGLPDLAKRVLRRLEVIRQVWATPAWEARQHLLRMIDAAIADNTEVVNIACHSSEFVVNSLAECDSPAKIDEIFRRFEAIFARLAAHPAARFMTLTTAALQFSGAAAVSAAGKAATTFGAARR